MEIQTEAEVPVCVNLYLIKAELVLRRTIVPTMASLANSMAYVFGSGTGEMLIGPVGFIACATLSNSSPYVVLEAMPPANP